MAYKSKSLSEEKFWQTNEWFADNFKPDLPTTFKTFLGFCVVYCLTYKLVSPEKAGEHAIAFVLALMAIPIIYAILWVFHFVFLAGSEIWKKDQDRIEELDPSNPSLPISLITEIPSKVYHKRHAEKNTEGSHYNYHQAINPAHIEHTFSEPKTISCELEVKEISSHITKEYVFLGQEVPLGQNRSSTFNLLSAEALSHMDGCQTRAVISIKSDIVDISKLRIASNLYYELEFLFRMSGYRPIKKKAYLIDSGFLQFSKPEIWPIISSEKCDECGLVHIDFPKKPWDNSRIYAVDEHGNEIKSE